MPKRTSPKVEHALQRIDYKFLELDSQNPRFLIEANRTQEELAKLLWEEMAVDEVAMSIAQNGYFEQEPLIAIKRGNSNYFTVIEGNRRLAAVRVLLDPQLRKLVKAEDLPKLSTEAQSVLQSLPVYVVPSRETDWQYIGFRHINGPKPWDAFSKAKYVAKLHTEYGIPLDEISRKISDRHQTVKRIYRGYEVLRQAENQIDYSTEDSIKAKFAFSHLYTALDQGEFQKFLGIEPSKSLRPNPVPKGKLKNLRELLLWLYGSKRAKKKPLIQTQSPDLNILREVIASEEGKDALRSGYTLYKAKEIADGQSRRLREALTRAKEDLTQANGVVTIGYDGEESPYLIVQDILHLTNELKLKMEQVRASSNK